MKRCFVISPIGEDGSETRIQSDSVFEYIVKEALAPLGYEIERADKISESGIITSQIIDRLVSSELVVADLSRHNANVFYELAIRHMVGKPFIHLIDSNERIPFDVAASRSIYYSLDLPGARRAQNELALQAQNIESSLQSNENPISIAIDLSSLNASPDPISTAIRQIESDISFIRHELLSYSATADLILMQRRLEEEKLGDVLKDVASGMSGSWTDDNVELLKFMWNQGRSAAQIARTFGVSRNAVIGKIHRLGIRGIPDESDDIESTK